MVVDSISPSSVQRILASQKLKPWRVHHWLSCDVPRDEAFRQAVRNICDLYTRQLAAHERVLSVDEKTSLDPGRERRPIGQRAFRTNRCASSTSMSAREPSTCSLHSTPAAVT